MVYSYFLTRGDILLFSGGLFLVSVLFGGSFQRRPYCFGGDDCCSIIYEIGPVVVFCLVASYMFVRLQVWLVSFILSK